jgi:predicted nucleotidyltransferase
MVAEIEQRLRAFFMAHPCDLDAAYLFGSVARGTAGPDSDVDVAVLPSFPQPGTLASLHLDLEGALERTVGRTVQIVALDLAPWDLVHRVLRDGIVVYEGDRRRRIAFEVRARNEYFDILPVLQRYRSRAS